MSAVEEVTIMLEHDIDEQYQYEPGEVIQGKVRIKVSRPTAIRTVTIRVVGEANVSWKEPEDTSGMHQADEKYVDVSKVILDSQRSQPHNLPVGDSDIPFQYQLPGNLPSSFIGKFGNVTYTMKATVTGVKANDTAITSEPFLVMRCCLLPPSASQSFQLAQEKRFWGCCSFGTISARLSMEGRAGVPGGDVFMHAEVKNQSSRLLTAMQASLVMVSTYQAHNNCIGFNQVVSKKRDEFEVDRGEGRRWNYVRLTLPPYLPETSLEHCDIIDIEYIFQFRVEIAGGAELRMETPFLVGTYFAGQESQRNHSVSPAFNSEWTIQGQGFNVNGGERADFRDNQNPWGLGDRVPELQNDKSVVRNPLYWHGSVQQPGREGKEIPEEQMENTRL